MLEKQQENRLSNREKAKSGRYACNTTLQAAGDQRQSGMISLDVKETGIELLGRPVIIPEYVFSRRHPSPEWHGHI
jgi:hypothetical protein